ncbi:hypothetical protein Pyrfu_0715 [Pyrolobus fumarii 1A]|uniref:ASCH domain-containing protein n=1 Tax=Pyrolobus fumarii (strain DSM 11204 / 1A) TaxID=694429 RepID=G0ED25_PYRF1|nr:DNA-binding protein [Pyrolobus fumarii]AEM38584.1 hypothetical protein Pyrfu_0715 [Pyrolobus fumarii 1A]
MARRRSVQQVEPQTFLMSIRPQFAFQILRGEKKFELRRWIGVPVAPGSVVVIYASGSVKALVGEFLVGRVYHGAPEEVWKQVMMHPSPGVDRDDWPYIRGAKKAMALEVEKVIVYPRQVTLQELRRIIPGWQPPISYKVLREGDPLYELIVKRLRRLAGYDEELGVMEKL